MITLRSSREIHLMRQAGLVVWEAHRIAAPLVQPGAVTGKHGKALPEITLDAVLAGEVTMEDLRITPHALQAQADVARDVGRPTLALNFEREVLLTRDLDIERTFGRYRGERHYVSFFRHAFAGASDLSAQVVMTARRDGAPRKLHEVGAVVAVVVVPRADGKDPA